MVLNYLRNMLDESSPEFTLFFRGLVSIFANYVLTSLFGESEGSGSSSRFVGLVCLELDIEKDRLGSSAAFGVAKLKLKAVT